MCLNYSSREDFKVRISHVFLPYGFVYVIYFLAQTTADVVDVILKIFSFEDVLHQTVVKLPIF